MDQQKMLRLLRMLMKLSGKRFCTLREVMDILGCSERTAYRYLETFETAGFLLERNKGQYRLQKNNINTRSLQSLMHFSEEELIILYETIELIEGTSPVKEQLIRKLNVLYDYKILEQLKQGDDLIKIQKISDAIQNKKQVILKNYRSSNSDKITDRKVEPFDYLPDYRSVWCYEHESNNCKQFKLARIYQIEIIQKDWQNESLHQIPFTDVFRISAQEPVGRIKALLSLKAYNLLIEEYPLSKEFITQKDKGYELNIPVAGFNGIGRFVMGLPGEIKVLGPKKFEEFLKKERKKFY